MLNFYGQCELPIYDVGNGGPAADMLEDAINWFYEQDGNTVVHCYHGVDRTGTLSSLILALERCAGLPEPQRTECINDVHEHYMTGDGAPGGPVGIDRYPVLPDAFRRCADSLIPAASPTPSPTPTPTPMPVPMPTP